MDVIHAIEQTKYDLILLYGKLRRFCMTTLATRQIRNQLRYRKGTCKQCAACCKFVFRCPWLDEKNLCKVYHSRLRPLVCRRFPLDERDAWEVFISSGRQCGYSFRRSDRLDSRPH